MQLPLQPHREGGTQKLIFLEDPEDEFYNGHEDRDLIEMTPTRGWHEQETFHP